MVKRRAAYAIVSYQQLSKGKVMKKIFVLQPFQSEFESIYNLITQAVSSDNVSIFRADEIALGGKIIEAIYEAIESADLIICDISRTNPNVMYELGFAHALNKPVILISQSTDSIPFDIRSVRTLVYDIHNLVSSREFIIRLQSLIKEALESPDKFSNRPKTETQINKVFVSYSHKDVEFLNRLLVHLRPLEFEGLIDLWVDTKIKAGEKWKVAIENALEHSRVAILLISADFLASTFIVENELPPLLANAELEGTKIIPVIVKPCRFTRDKHLSVFQAINNPTSPIANLSDGKREEIYDKVAEAVESFMVM